MAAMLGAPAASFAQESGSNSGASGGAMRSATDRFRNANADAIAHPARYRYPCAHAHTLDHANAVGCAHADTHGHTNSYAAARDGYADTHTYGVCPTLEHVHRHTVPHAHSGGFMW